MYMSLLNYKRIHIKVITIIKMERRNIIERGEEILEKVQALIIVLEEEGKEEEVENLVNFRVNKNKI